MRDADGRATRPPNYGTSPRRPGNPSSSKSPKASRSSSPATSSADRSGASSEGTTTAIAGSMRTTKKNATAPISPSLRRAAGPRTTLGHPPRSAGRGRAHRPGRRRGAADAPLSGTWLTRLLLNQPDALSDTGMVPGHCPEDRQAAQPASSRSTNARPRPGRPSSRPRNSTASSSPSTITTARPGPQRAGGLARKFCTL